MTALTRGEVMAARAADPADTDLPSKACIVCGAQHNRGGNFRTCSDECAETRERERNREATARRREAKPKAKPKAKPEPEAVTLVEGLAAELAEAVKARARELLGL